MSSPPQPSNPPAATKDHGPHHRIINSLLLILDEGPQEGMTCNELAARSVYAITTIRLTVHQARLAGLMEISGTRTAARERGGGTRQNVWRRTTAGQP